MSSVLRGREGTLEQLLGLLAEVGLRELPRHIRAGAFSHSAIATALVNKTPVAYGVGVKRSTVSRRYERIFIRYQSPVGDTPPIVVAGSGETAITRMGIRAFRPLLRMARAFEKGQLPAETVSDALAAVSYNVHLGESTVGPRSIILWSGRNGTGGQTCYTGIVREANRPKVPTIANGWDIQPIIGLTTRMVLRDPAAALKREFRDIDADRMNEELRKLPSGPDDKLR
jgi:hypothetical protein